MCCAGPDTPSRKDAPLLLVPVSRPSCGCQCRPLRVQHNFQRSWLQLPHERLPCSACCMCRRCIQTCPGNTDVSLRKGRLSVRPATPAENEQNSPHVKCIEYLSAECYVPCCTFLWISSFICFRFGQRRFGQRDYPLF